MKIIKKIKNAIGIMIARYIIHTGTEGWLVTRKNDTQQVIKVYSKQAYENVIRLAVEKQKPVKVKKIKVDGSRYNYTYRCPICHCSLPCIITDYCSNCGQKFERSDTDDKLD